MKVTLLAGKLNESQNLRMCDLQRMNILVPHFDAEQALGGQSLICNRTGFVIFKLYFTCPLDSRETNKATPVTHHENSGVFCVSFHHILSAGLWDFPSAPQ